MSLTYNEGNLLNKEYTANEETIILVLAVANYNNEFNNFIDVTEWTDNNTNEINKIEYYNPDSELSQKTLYSYDILNNDNNAYIMGYINPFEYLRNKKNIIAGDILDKWNNWTYNSDLKNEKLGIYSLKAHKNPFLKTLITSEGDQFICEFEFNTQIKRHLKPQYIIDMKNIKGE